MECDFCKARGVRQIGSFWVCAAHVGEAALQTGGKAALAAYAQRECEAFCSFVERTEPGMFYAFAEEDLEDYGAWFLNR